MGLHVSVSFNRSNAIRAAAAAVVRLRCLFLLLREAGTKSTWMELGKKSVCYVCSAKRAYFLCWPRKMQTTATKAAAAATATREQSVLIFDGGRGKKGHQKSSSIIVLVRCVYIVLSMALVCFIKIRFVGFVEWTHVCSVSVRPSVYS